MSCKFCTKCGSEKFGSYLNGSWCNKCTEEARSLRRARKRADSDLPVWGSGRDPKCKICRIAKEEPYVNGSLCRTCKLQKAKAAYQKKARLEGTPIRATGRNPLCKCGVIKERINDSYCSACTTIKKRELRQKRALDPDFQKKEREKANKIYQENYQHRLKRICREATHRRISSGKLIKEPCEVCGDIKVEAHHDDYTQPMKVRWLCKKHHVEHHKNLNTKE